MTNLALATMLHVAILGAQADSYADAYRRSAETGRPMVVMVGAQWCGACRQMKQNVLPEVRKQCVLGNVGFATVDLDEDPELGRKLTGGGPIPQMLMYRKTSQGWLRRKLVGGQSPQTVAAFIRHGIELAETARRADAPARSASAQPTTPLDGTPEDHADWIPCGGYWHVCCS